jgi:large subunit ribosomal protein L13
MAKQEYTIDAAGKSLGRIAAEAAKALMGKKGADYTPHVRSDVKVTIVNAGKILMREKKRVRKTYTSYSGYPGGFKKESLSHLASRKGMGEPLRRAIKRMLPRNTFLVPRLKNLHISE